MSKVKKKEKNNSLLDTTKGNGPEKKKISSKLINRLKMKQRQSQIKQNKNIIHFKTYKKEIRN